MPKLNTSPDVIVKERDVYQKISRERKNYISYYCRLDRLKIITIKLLNDIIAHYWFSSFSENS